MWRNPFFRAAVRTLTGFTLFIAVVLVGLLFRPLSFDWASNRLQAAWLEATGLDLQFDRAEAILYNGRVLVVGPRFVDPESGRVLLSFSKFEMNLRLKSILKSILSRDKQIDIQSAVIFGPLELNFEERDGVLAFGEGLERLVEIVQRAQENKTQVGNIKVRLKALHLTNANFNLVSVGPAGRKPILRIEGSNFIAEFGGSSVPSNILLVGKLRGPEEASNLNLQLRPDALQEEMRIDLTVDPIDSRLHLMIDLENNFRTEQIRLQGMLRRHDKGHWVLRSETRSDRIVLAGMGVHGVDYVISNPILDTWVRWRNEEKTLELIQLKFDSADTELDASGNLELFEPYRYDLGLAKLKITGPAISLAEKIIFQETRILRPSEGEIRLRGRVAGRLNEAKPETFEGDLFASGIVLSVPNFSEPIEGLKLKARVDPSRVKLDEGFAIVQGIPINLEGEMIGAPLDGEIEHAWFNWRVVEGEVAGLSDLIAETQSNDAWRFTFSGGVTGSGSIEVREPRIGHWAEMLEDAYIDGKLSFHDARVATSKMSEPITGLSGTLEIEANKAIFSDITGSIGDADFSLDGELTGEGNPWTRPRAAVDVKLSANLESLTDYFSWFDLKAPDLPELGGRVRTVAHLEGPVERWRESSFEGTVSIENFSVNLDAPAASGLIEIPRIEFTIDPTSIIATPTSGTWDGLEVALEEASLSTSALSVRTKVEGEIDGLGNRVPLLGDAFKLARGDVNITNRTELRRRDASERPVDTLAELWFATMEQRESDDWNLKDSWAFDTRGDIRLSDFELLLGLMPESAKLTQVYGTLRYDTKGIWTPTDEDVRRNPDAYSDTDTEVSLKPGANSGLSHTTAKIVFASPDHSRLRMDFKLSGTEINIDDWVKPWKRPEPSDGASEPAGKLKKIPRLLTVDLTSSAFVFKGLKGENLSAYYKYLFLEPGVARMDWATGERIGSEWVPGVATFGEGTVLASGHLSRQGETYRQGHHIEVKRVEAADIMAAFMPDLRNSGFSSGLASGTLDIASEGPKGTPFSGDIEDLLIENSRFVSSAIFGDIGKALKLDSFFDDITFTQIKGDIDIEKGVLSLPKRNPLTFENPSLLYPLSLVADGTIGPEQAMDLRVSVQFLPRLVDSLPIFGELVGEILKQLTGRLIRFNVTGTLSKPRVAPAVPIVDLPRS